MVKRKLKVGIVDYSMGNLHSVAKAISSQGADARISSRRKELESSDLLVLPGVGAFGAAMANLAHRRLDDFIRSWIDDGKPYLGICLGLQLLFEKSEEDPRIPGLGVLKGPVVSFKPRDFKKGSYLIPHMGWNSAETNNRNGKDLMQGIRSRDLFYFVHTYFPQPKDKNVIFTTTAYGRTFCSSVRRGSLFACQFHPEKSSSVGLRLLKNVISAASDNKPVAD